MGEEKSVLQWGGLGGLLSGVLVILALITLIIVINLVPVTGAEDNLVKFPERRAGLFLYSSLRLAAVIAALPLFLALYRALRRASPASVLSASVLALLSLPLLALGVMLLSPFLYPLHHTLYTEATTDAERMTVVVSWLAMGGLFQTSFLVGALLLALAFIPFGVAMFGTPNFGKVFGGVSVVLGVAGVVVGVPTAIISGTNPPEYLYAIVGIIFPLLFGWKVYSLSRSPSPD